MTPKAQKHLTKARDLLGRGEAYYRRAAAEIEKAKAAGATNKEAGVFLGHSEAWVRTILAWNANPSSSSTPFSGQADQINLRKTKQRLREATPEELTAILASLPDDALDRLARAIYPKGRRERRKVWVGPQRRLRLFRIVRDLLLDAEFVASEIEEMTVMPDDRTELVALLDAIERRVTEIKTGLRVEPEKPGELVALEGGRR